MEIENFDHMILSVIPHHRTDALYRVYDVDRDIITTNLIENYE